MYKRSIFSLYIITYSCISFEVTEIIQDLNLSQYCPYTNYCTQNAQYNFGSRSERQPCCASCMCTADCHLYGNCCPDAKHKVNNTLQLPVCYFPVHNVDYDTEHYYNQNMFSGINSYNTFVKCPETYQDSSKRELCEGINVQRGIDDFVVVSDEREYIYKNKHCAACHGVKRYIAWKLKIKCPTTEDVKTIQLTQPMDTFKTCMIWSYPPKASIGRKSLCYKTYDACNITGRMTAYNAFLEESCQAYTLYYSHIFHGRNFPTMFKNVHCFACNEGRFSVMKTCLLEQNQRQRSVFLHFTAVINISSHEIMTKPAKRKRCSKLQIFDPLFKRCRTLTCPMGSTAFYGECLGNYLNTHGFSVRMLVLLWPSSNTASFSLEEEFFENRNNTSHFERLGSALANSTTQSKKGCGHCRTIIHVSGSGTQRHFEVLVSHHTNSKCSIDDLFSSAYTYAKNNEKFTVNIDGKTLSYKTKVKFDWIAGTKWLKMLTTRFCDLPIPFRGELVCPKITLSEIEYSELMIKVIFNGPVRRKIVVDNDLSDNVNDVNNVDKDVILDETPGNNTVIEFDLCVKEYMFAVSRGYRITISALTRCINATLWVVVLFKLFAVIN